MADALPLTLSTPMQYVKGVGPARAGQLLALNIRTCGDLLFHYPRDYLTYTAEASIKTVKVGEMATIRGILLQTRMIAVPRKPRRFEALLEDASGSAGGRCVLTWFNAYGLDQKLQPGMHIRVTGKVTVFRDRPQIVQPQWEKVSDGESAGQTGERIEAVYPATTELTSAVMGRLIGGCLEELVGQVAEWLPAGHLAERNFMTRREALVKIHQPRTRAEHIAARRTLAYHEFFLHQTAVALKRYHARNSNPALPLRVDDAVDGRIRALLPFALTGAQDRVVASIRKDLGGAKPMNRLLQGDVGSGKTVVALYAMLAAAATRRGQGPVRGQEDAKEKGAVGRGEAFEGHQAALLAPTEILAEQHSITLQKLLEGKKVKIALLTGSMGAKEKESVRKRLAEGSIHLIVGTHALLAEAVKFQSLALVVIDEQHKFGVEQRSAIRTKPMEAGGGMTPHILVMTATPIPRTLAMTAFGDLDVSVIDELPPGRQTIHTRLSPSSSREDIYGWVATRVKEGEQAYVVVPAIDESELELRTVAGTQEELQKGPLKDFRVGLLHGRMATETRQHIMERFRQKLIDVLVATTVIEVGVDVPNATIMVIEHAERFGLSQLHQLRGRVGRGLKQSYCILLGDQATEDSIARLQAMVKHASGFKIAEEDLKIRGMGQLLGTAQSGSTDLHFADLLFDPHLLPMSRRDAFNTIAADPRLLDASHGELRKEVLGKFGDTISLADVG